MDPGWEVNVGRAAEVGASRIVWTRWEELRLFEGRSMTSAFRETPGEIPYPVMACNHVTSRHAKARMGPFSVQHRVATWAKPIVRIHGHPKTGLQFGDKFGRIKGEPKYFGGYCG